MRASCFPTTTTSFSHRSVVRTRILSIGGYPSFSGVRSSSLSKDDKLDLARVRTGRIKVLERPFRIQQNGYWAVIHEFDLHHRLKATCFALDATFADFVHEILVKLTRALRRCR